MHTDFIQSAKNELAVYLKKNYLHAEFTILFNGDFFIANANKEISEDEINIDLSTFALKEINRNKIILTPSKAWLKSCILSIEEYEASDGDVAIYSQVARLSKQLEYSLVGGPWEEKTYCFAKDLLYMIHTKSKSIRLNIVKRCAKEYNKMQRQGAIPVGLVKGYKNALCQIEL